MMNIFLINVIMCILRSVIVVLQRTSQLIYLCLRSVEGQVMGWLIAVPAAAAERVEWAREAVPAVDRAAVPGVDQAAGQEGRQGLPAAAGLAVVGPVAV